MSIPQPNGKPPGASRLARVSLFCRFVAKVKIIARPWACPHSHTFHVPLPKQTQWYSFGKPMGPHDSLELVGCYVCGKVWCRDWKS